LNSQANREDKNDPQARYDRFMDAISFKPVSRPPHFEQIFDLSEEAFGVCMPSEREMQAASAEVRKILFEKLAEIYARIIDRFKWDALLIWNPVIDYDLLYEFIPFLKRYLRAYFGEQIPVGSYVWWAVHCIDTVKDYMQFSVDLYENPAELHAQAEEMIKIATLHAKKLAEAGCDLIEVGSDMAYNSGPFLSPSQFKEFVTPYLFQIIKSIKDMKCKCILHSDGNLNPVMDQIIAVEPDVLQSIDPMAGMDIREIKKLTYGKFALMGIVNCSVLQSGTPEHIIDSASYCLRYGAEGGGYIYSSSNTIFKGIPLGNYELMLNVFHEKYGF
jgi:uroporphyrinogen decarboxylase